MKGMEPNPLATRLCAGLSGIEMGQVLLGNVVMVGHDGGSEFTDVTPAVSEWLRTH